MKRSPWIWAATVVIALGILSAFLLVNHRIETENQAKVAEIALDYTEIQKLADQSEHDIRWWLEAFREMGAMSAAVGEETFYTLREEGRQLDYGLIYDIRKNLDWQKDYPAAVAEKVANREYKDEFLIVRIRDEQTKALVKKGLNARYDVSLFDFYSEADTDYYIVKNRPEDIYYTSKTKLIDKDSKESKEVSTPAFSMAEEIGLGFDPVKIENIQAADLEVIPRSINNKVYPEKLVAAYTAELKALGITPRLVLFIGKEVTGYPDRQDQLTQFMAANGVSVGLIETPVQRGQIEQADIVKLTRDLNYNAVRAFSVMPYIQKRYKYYNYEGAEEIENTMYRAITERNIRVIYFKPFKYNDLSYVTHVEEYRSTFADLRERLKPHGISIGKFSTMPANYPSRTAQSLIAAALWAILLLAGDRLWKMRSIVGGGLLALGLIGAMAAFRIAPNLSSELTALGASIIFPSIGSYYLLRSMKAQYLSDDEDSFSKVLFQGVGVLLVTAALSMLGGLVIAGTLSGSEYLLEMQIFRGVKLSQLLPLVIMAGMYLFSFGYRRSRSEIKTHRHFAGDFKTILLEDIKIYYVVLAGIVGAVGYIYIARTGHETNIQPSDFEMISRNFLEMTLLARPRTKEFLFAFPAIVAGFVFARYHLKKLIFPVVLCGMIGLTSVANTFSHLRTPVYLSVVRTAYSAGFGALLGIVGFAGLWFIISGLHKRIRSLVE